MGSPGPSVWDWTPKSLLTGVQSVEALERLLEYGCNLKYLTKGLHAKFYRFDRTNILITSANMTLNGLNNNYEIGVALKPTLFNESTIKNPNVAVTNYVDSLIRFIEHQSSPVTTEMLDKCKVFAEKSKSLQDIIKKFEQENPIEVDFEPYIKFAKNLINTQNLSTDLLSTSIFQGFSENNWDAFNHDWEVNPENITKLRYLLNDEVNPILKRFYLQLKGEPIFKQNLGALQSGYSQNLRLKTQFPFDRYLYLTKKIGNKRADHHVGVPSYIIGMGKNEFKSIAEDTADGNWLEIRTGVEEDALTEISSYGENFIKKILTNKENVLKKFKQLGSGWFLTHGSYYDKKQTQIELTFVTSGYLEQKIGAYLVSRKPADLQLRRRYFTTSPADREILFSPKICKVIANDLNNLSYFFDLAHK